MATTPVLLPEKFHGQRSMVGCSPWGSKELDLTECLCVCVHIHTPCLIFTVCDVSSLYSYFKSENQGSESLSKLPWSHT